MIKKVLLLLLKVYQKFFTLIGYGSCRYYPTCSEYAKWQIENNNIFKAFYYSTKRILKCNQLFEGGIDYPVVKKNFTFGHKNIKIKYWYVPCSEENKNKRSLFTNQVKDCFYIIKNFKGKV